MSAFHNIHDVISEMKRKPRTGWVDHEIPNPETVWQHSVGMRVFARDLAARYLGPQYAEHCAKLGAVHDVIEGIVPDIPPSWGIPTAQKHELEVLAIDHIGTFSHGGQRIRGLWLEFEDGQTIEAAFVRKVDKLHVVPLALSYEQMNACRYSLQPFWDYAWKHVESSPLAEVWKNLCSQRPSNATSKPILERRPKPPGTFEQIRSIVLSRIQLDLHHV